MTTTTDQLLNDLMPAWHADAYSTASDQHTLRMALARCASLYLRVNRHMGDPDWLTGSCTVLVEVLDWDASELVPDYLPDLDVQAGDSDDDTILPATAERVGDFEVNGRRFVVYDVDGE